MKVTDHPFTNSDREYDLIMAFLSEITAYPDLDHSWDAGRMNWWRYNVHAEKGMEFFKANAHYWITNTDRVVGLFISEYGGDDFFVVVHPDFSALLPEALNWGVGVWGQGKPSFSTSVFTHDRGKIEALMAAGFREQGHESNVRTYDLRGYDFSYDLAVGCRLLTFQEVGDYGSRNRLVEDAFGNPSYSEARLRSLQASPGYRPELDLVIVNAQGESVAYCTGWIEEDCPRSSYIEPMGTKTDYRRKGLGTALAKACFRRLSDMGVVRVSIASAAEPAVSNYLYDSLDPVRTKRAYRYSLILAA